MIRRKDLMKILFVGVCICHVCPAHPCGDNPMRFVNNFAHSKGIDSASMLHFMRLNTPSDYSILMKEYRRYLECTQMVHNGYFKRSVDHVLSQSHTDAHNGYLKRSVDHVLSPSHTDALPSSFKEAALQNIRPRVWDDNLKLLKQTEDRGLKLNKNRISYMGYRLKSIKRDSLFTPEGEALSETPTQYTQRSSRFKSPLKRHLDSLLDQDRRQGGLWDIIDTIKRKR